MVGWFESVGECLREDDNDVELPSDGEELLTVRRGSSYKVGRIDLGIPT